MSDQIRAWPGGTGGVKLRLNYAARFLAQRVAAGLGYQQLLWILGETIAEAGAMNVFAVFNGGKRMILLGVTRSSDGACPPLPPTYHIRSPATTCTRTLRELFCVGTAAVVMIPAAPTAWREC
ncbi:aminotransferase [Lactarius quietus]|nr:aminotransferase [Lactarius quietus]